MTGAGDLPVEAEFLDEQAVAALLARRQRAYSRAAQQAEEGEGRRVLVWSIGGENYASPLDDVATVVPIPHLTSVPGAPAALLGLVSVRGVIHNLFDPAPALGTAAEAAMPAARMLVLRGAPPLIALRVANVIGVDRLAADDDLENAPTRLVLRKGGGHVALVSTPILVDRLRARRGVQGG